MNISEIFAVAILFMPTYRKFHIFYFGFVCITELCLGVIADLHKSGLIDSSNGLLSSLPFGAVMAKFFLSVRTMNQFQKVSLSSGY